MVDHVLYWQAQEGADHYLVRVSYDDYNGYEVPVKGTSYPLNLYQAGTYNLSVRYATQEGGYSQYAPAYSYRVEADVPVTPSGEEGVVLRGDGTKDNPLLVYTAKELATLKTGLKEEEDGTLRQLYYRLMADIDLGRAEWTPIGDYGNPFEGIFDGNGHTISNFVQTKPYGTSSYRHDGLFGWLVNATVVNLHLEGFEIDPGQINNTVDIGGLAGGMRNSVIENCSVKGTITVNRTLENDQRVRIGMLVGTVTQSSNGARIERCRTEGDINARFAFVYAGGIVGTLQASYAEILNCVSKVNVTSHCTAARTTSIEPVSFAGQAIGYASAVKTLYGLVGLGTVKATGRDGTSAGNIGQGLLGGAAHSSASNTCNLVLSDVYFDYQKAGVTLGEPFDTEEEIADYYIVGGSTIKQNNRSTVYARTTEELADMQNLTGLDPEVWEIKEGLPSLKEYFTEFFTVTYIVGDRNVGTQVVLKGQPATCPFTYDGDDVVVVKWDYDDSPITQDTIINAIIRQGE